MAAGFTEFEITWRADVFSGAPQESSAMAFGTKGINFRARKPIPGEEPSIEIQGVVCEIDP